MNNAKKILFQKCLYHLLQCCWRVETLNPIMMKLKEIEAALLILRLVIFKSFKRKRNEEEVCFQRYFIQIQTPLPLYTCLAIYTEARNKMRVMQLQNRISMERPFQCFSSGKQLIR